MSEWGDMGGCDMGGPSDSASWNMALQTEKDPAKALSRGNPLFIIIGAFVIFFALITLPWFLDVFETEKGAQIEQQIQARKEANRAALSEQSFQAPDSTAGAGFYRQRQTQPEQESEQSGTALPQERVRVYVDR